MKKFLASIFAAAILLSDTTFAAEGMTLRAIDGGTGGALEFRGGIFADLVKRQTA